MRKPKEDRSGKMTFMGKGLMVRSWVEAKFWHRTERQDSLRLLGFSPWQELGHPAVLGLCTQHVPKKCF